jgi:DNA-directed RNA polymerase subunit omega
MLEELKEEHIVNKVGGRFKLSTLIQKRLVQLNQGSRPLVSARTNDKMKIVLQEILEDKIFLDTSNEVRATAAAPNLGFEGPQFSMDED